MTRRSSADRNSSPRIESAFEVEFAETDDALLDTYSVMKQLRPDVPRNDYLRRIKLQQREIGFRMATVSEKGRILCVAGFRICRSLGWGKFLYVDDLVTAKEERSRGAGKAMFKWLIAFAKRTRCEELRLDSAVYRHEAHRFYLRERMDIACFNFRLDLRPKQKLGKTPSGRLR